MASAIQKRLTPSALDDLYAAAAAVGGCSEQRFLTIALPFFLEEGSEAASKLELSALFRSLVLAADGATLTLPRLVEALHSSSVSSALSAVDSGAACWTFCENEGAAEATRASLRMAQVLFCAPLRVFFATDDASPRVVVYASTTRVPGNSASGWRQLATLDTRGGARSGGSVLALEFLAEYSLLVLGVGGHTLQFWDCRPLARVAAGGGGAPACENLLRDAPSFEAERDPANPRRPWFVCAAPTPAHNVRALAYMRSTRRLLTAGVEQGVHVWSLDAVRVGYATWKLRLMPLGVLGGHARGGAVLLALPELGLFLSGGREDGTLCVWGAAGAPDGAGGVRSAAGSQSGGGGGAGGVYLLKAHASAHKWGIRGFAFSAGSRQVLSAGGDAYLQRWGFSGVGDEAAGWPLGLLGHAEGCDLLPGVVAVRSVEGGGSAAWDPVVNALVVGAGAGAASAALAQRRRADPHFAHFVSVDETGVLRWWDGARTAESGARLLQSFAPLKALAGNVPFKPVGLAVVRFAEGGGGGASATGDSDAVKGAVAEAAAEGSGRTRGALLLALGGGLRVFEALRVDDDRVVPAGALFSDAAGASGAEVLAPCGADLRFFCAASGALLRVAAGAFPAEASPGVVAFDGARRKMFLGLANGCVLAVDAGSGALLKALPRHYGEATGVAYVAPDELVVTAGRDGRLHVCCDRVAGGDGRRKGLVRYVKAAHGHGAPVAALAVDHALSLIATAGGAGVRVWDFQELSLVTSCEGHYADVAALAWAAPFSVLVSGDAAGVVCVWAVARGRPAGVCLAILRHRPCAHVPMGLGTDGESREAARTDLADAEEALRAGLATAAAGGASEVGGGAAAFAFAAVAGSPRAPPLPALTSAAAIAAATPALRAHLRSLPGAPLLAGARSGVGIAGITALCVVPEGSELAASLVGPGGAEPLAAGTPGLEAAVAVAAAGGGARGGFPTLAVGDELGRLALYDFGAVLGGVEAHVALEEEAATASPRGGRSAPTPPTLPTLGDSASPASFSPAERMRISARRALKLPNPDTSSAAPAAARLLLRLRCAGERVAREETTDAGCTDCDAAPLPPPAFFEVRAREAPLPPSKRPCAGAGYNPRKRVQRVGASLMQAAATPAPSAKEAPPALGGGWASDSCGSDGGEPPFTDSAVFSQGSLETFDSSAPSSFFAGDAASAPFSSVLSSSDARAAFAALLQRAPPPPLPLLAHVVGARWRPCALTYAHGMFYRAAAPPAAAGAAPAAAPAVAAAAVARGAFPSLAALKSLLPAPPSPPQAPPLHWRGFILRSLSLSRAVEFPALLSSGADGTVRAFSLRGELQGSLPVVAGFFAPPPPLPPPLQQQHPSELPSEDALAAAVAASARAPMDDALVPPVPSLSFWRPVLDAPARATAIAASCGALDAALAAAAASSGGTAQPLPLPQPQESVADGTEEGASPPAAAAAAAAVAAAGAHVGARRHALQQLAGVPLRTRGHAGDTTPFAVVGPLSPRAAAALDIAALADASHMVSGVAEEGELSGAPAPLQSPQAARRTALVAAVAARARDIAASADDFNIKRDVVPREEEDVDDAAESGARDAAASGGGGGAPQRSATQVAREAALDVTRAVVRSGALRPEATQKRVAGVKLTDAGQVELLMRALERDRRETPCYYQEVARGLCGGAAGSEVAPPPAPALSPFLRANLARLEALPLRVSLEKAPPASPLRRAVPAAPTSVASPMTSPAKRTTGKDPQLTVSAPLLSPAALKRVALVERYAAIEKLAGSPLPRLPLGADLRRHGESERNE